LWDGLVARGTRTEEARRARAAHKRQEVIQSREDDQHRDELHPNGKFTAAALSRVSQLVRKSGLEAQQPLCRPRRLRTVGLRSLAHIFPSARRLARSRPGRPCELPTRHGLQTPGGHETLLVNLEVASQISAGSQLICDHLQFCPSTCVTP
jgi:hypothetical protein